MLLAIPLVVSLYALIGFFVVPWAAHRWVVPMVSDSLNGDVSVDTIRTNPFTLSLTLEGVSVTDEQGAKVLGLGRLYGNLQASSLFREGFVLRDVMLEEPYVLAVLEEDGSLNLAKLVKPSDEPSTEPITLPRVRGDSLAIKAATVEFIDRMIEQAPERKVTPISFRLDAFDTQPLHGNRHRFSAATEAAENVTWDGEVFFDPLDATGTVTVTDFDLSVYEPYIRQFAPLSIESGLTSLVLKYQVAPVRSDKAVNATLETLSVKGLDVQLAEHPLLAVRLFEIDAATADAVGRSVEVERVAVSGVEVTGQREADGTFAILKALEAVTAGVAADADTSSSVAASQAALLPPELAEGVPRPYDEAVRALIETANDAVQPWTLRLETLEVDDTQATWRDLAMEPDVELAVVDTRLKAGPISSEDGFAVDFEAATNIVSGGAMAVAGRVEPMEQRATVASFENIGFALAPLGPYVQQADARLRLPEGTLDLKGSGLGASLGDDGVPEVAVGEFTVGGTVDLEVHELGPALSVPLRDLSVELLGLDTAAGDPANLAVGTRIYDGSISVNGTALPNLAEPLKSTIDLSVVIDKFRLEPLTPVSGEYVGRAIADGTLNTKQDGPVTVQLAQQQLDAVIPIRILGFNFGGKVQSENATSLPVGLAVAVLKGPDGSISPPPIKISGDLSDPSISIIGIVGHAVTNLVVGVASSPFQMLGGLVPGGDGEAGEAPDLSFVAFAPGSSALTDEAAKKLGMLGAVMAKRPALSMAVKGLPARALDETPLRRAAFESALRAKTAASLPQGDARRADPALIAVTEAQYREAVRFAYAAMRPPATNAASLSTEPAEGVQDAVKAEVTTAEPLKSQEDLAAEEADPMDFEADDDGLKTQAEASSVIASQDETPQGQARAEPAADADRSVASSSASEELVVDEPLSLELELPVLADEALVATGEASARRNAAPPVRARRLRAGRSMHSRVSRVRAHTPVVVAEPEARPLSMPPSEQPIEKVTTDAAMPEVDVVDAPIADAESRASDADAEASAEARSVELAPEDSAISDTPVEARELDKSLNEVAVADGVEEPAGLGDVAESGVAAGEAGVSGEPDVPAELAVPFEDAEREVLARVPLAAEAFVDLRLARVQKVVDYLTGPAGLSASRVRALEEPAEIGSNEGVESPRVLFDLVAD
ncbi:MAG: DUF748 domain-containing protein [Planctomycetota bacterium]